MPFNSRRAARTLCAAALLFALCLCFAPRVLEDGFGRTARAAATFVVTNTNDVGPGSLRQAINDANNNPGLDTITFSVGSGVVTFRNAPPLPAVTDPVVIDGTTQPGFAGTPVVVLDGSVNPSGGNGLSLGGGSTVRGLVVSGFSNVGIALGTAGGNRVEGCYIGTDVTGTAALPNAGGGISVAGPNNVIGGATPAARNVISGNQFAGITVNRGAGPAPISGNVIRGNYVGTNAAGTAALPNAREGIRLAAFSTNAPVEGNLVSGNVVSGNRWEGIRFDGVFVNGNTVQGNLVGTDAGGTYAVPNGADGVSVAGAGHVIGGAAAGEGNVISGNGINGNGTGGGSGLRLGGSGHVVRGNLIGTNAAGTGAVPNLLDGVSAGGANIVVGGPGPGERNVVAFNGSAGVLVGATGPAGVTLRGNSIFSNSRFRDPNFAGPGIDLFPRGVTPNDAGDGDAGANNLQNFPVINAVGFGPAGTTVEGTLDSAPDTSYTIDFYANSTCGFLEHGEGARHLGSLVVTTDAAGDAAFGPTLPAVLAAGQVITATATDPAGNTSEFSRCDTSAAAVGSVGFEQAFLEVSEGAGVASVVVRRAGGATGAITVNYSATGGTAAAGADFTAVAGTLSFADGETTKMFTVPVSEDNIGNEFEETIRLSLTTAGDPDTLDSRSAADLIIHDNDPRPALSVGDVSAPEGDFNTSPFNFQVTLSRPSELPVSFFYNTAAGTAQPGFDYFPQGFPTRVTFSPGETTKTVAVSVIGDTAVEPDETFTLSLVDVTNAAVADGSALATILNDDGPPAVSLSLGDATVTEGDTGLTDAVFNVSLSAPTSKTVVVRVITVDESARFSRDYQNIDERLTFAPGETSKQVVVKIIGDNLSESTETFRVEFRDAVNAAVADGVGVGTILDNEGQPVLSVDDITVVEGDDGQQEAVFTVSVSVRAERGVSFSVSTAPGTATRLEDYSPSSGGGQISSELTSTRVTVRVNGDTVDEPDETFFVNLSNVTGAAVADAQGMATIVDDDDGTGPPTFQFLTREHHVTEGTAGVEVVVSRTGDASAPATVEYATEGSQLGPGSGSDRGDYTVVFGRLRFAAGETTKSFTVFITDDLFVEPEERVVMQLSNPTGGATVGSPAWGVIVIGDNDAVPSPANPSDETSFFVRQHYRDFLGREPDAGGLAFWSEGIESCGADQQCREVKRVDTSAAFFLSIEFQETGFLAYRAHKAAFGDLAGKPVPLTLRDFLFDSRLIGENVVVGTPGWPERLEANKRAYFAELVTRDAFAALYPQTMSPAEYVDALNSRASNPLNNEERNALVAALFNGRMSRAEVLRAVAEDESLKVSETNKAFVLMQYFGYLRRNPDDPQDTNFDGFFFWLNKLNQFNGNYVAAEMVKAFIQSIEYRHRFGQ